MPPAGKSTTVHLPLVLSSPSLFLYHASTRALRPSWNSWKVWTQAAVLESRRNVYSRAWKMLMTRLKFQNRFSSDSISTRVRVSELPTMNWARFPSFKCCRRLRKQQIHLRFLLSTFRLRVRMNRKL
ncbi:hypothetical protein PF010_g5211 [Phytophthora fragariae]|uniref:Uncharacterized protein n=1 Tax=Phytophthora fragariae TaxID=53985 RepID=A0A6G0LQ02_9STRA|nr:hypothetical protein PF010_g5211 [Phytophthora fragariae]